MLFRFSRSILLAAILVFLATNLSWSQEIRVATGGKAGFYHNDLFNIYNSKVKRFSDGEWECERAKETGTDGTLHNIKLVEKGEADIAFIQLGGLVETGANVDMIGVVMYELAHLTGPAKGKVTDADDLESKKGHSVGINTRSGSMVTFNVFKKFDKDYGNAKVVDTQNGTRAITEMQRGELDSMFFVSAPGTKLIKRITSSGLKFFDVDDSDFNDMKYNGKRLYEFVKVGKKQGYPNNFKTVCIPAVVIANRDWVSENPDVFDVLFDATTAAFNDVQVARKLTYYPKS